MAYLIWKLTYLYQLALLVISNLLVLPGILQWIHANPCQLTHYDITVHKLFQNAPYCTLPLTIRLVMEGIMCERLTKRCNLGSFCLNKFIWYIEYIFIQCITFIISILANKGQFIYSTFFFLYDHPISVVDDINFRHWYSHPKTITLIIGSALNNNNTRPLCQHTYFCNST